jgi:hypothetical protein
MLLKLCENALCKFVLQRLALCGDGVAERLGLRCGTYIRAGSVVEGCHNFIQESKIEFLVEVENAFHLC